MGEGTVEDGMSRRDFIGKSARKIAEAIARTKAAKLVMGTVAAGIAMSGCDDIEDTPANREEREQLPDENPLPLVEAGALEEEMTEEEKRQKKMREKLPSGEKKWLENGETLRKTDEKNGLLVLDTTSPGYALTYSKIASVQGIREIENPRERIITLIGWLGVMTKGRYGFSEGGTCNTYLSDVVVGLVGHTKFGSEYKRANGEPYVHGKGDPVWNMSKEKKDKIYQYLYADNFDEWLTEYGRSLGWEQITDQDELKRRLKEGWIGIGVVPKEQVAAYNAANDSTHSFVITYVESENEDNCFAVSYSTANTELRRLNSNDKMVNPVAGKYHTWVHKLPPPGQVNN